MKSSSDVTQETPFIRMSDLLPVVTLNIWKLLNISDTIIAIDQNSLIELSVTNFWHPYKNLTKTKLLNSKLSLCREEKLLYQLFDSRHLEACHSIANF